MKEINIRFEINGSIEMSGNIFIEEEAEEDQGKITIQDYDKPITINEMRKFYAKLREQEESENIQNK